MSKIKVRVHEAYFIGYEILTDVQDIKKKPHYFLNVRNNYKRRYLIITDILFFNELPEPVTKQHNITSWGHVYNEERLLPKVIAPQTEWETWIPVIEAGPFMFERFVVRSQTGRYYVSKKRKGVAPSGNVPG